MLIARQMEKVQVNPFFQEHAKLVTKQTQSIMADPKLKEQIGAVTVQMEAIVANPNFQEKAKLVVEQMVADPNFMEQAKLIAKAMMANPNSKNEEKFFSEKLEAMNADQKIEERAKRVSGQLEALLTDSNLQQQAKPAAEQMEKVVANQNFQKHAKLIAEEMESVKTNPNLHPSITQDSVDNSVVADNLVDDLVNKLFNRAFKSVSLAHMDDTMLKKSGGVVTQPAKGVKVSFAPAFSRLQSQSRPRSTQARASMLQGLQPAAQAYADIWVPLFKIAQENGLPDAIIHWGHPAAMGTVLLTMGLFGSYLGWQIRAGNGGESNVLTLGDTFAEIHPKLMLGAAFFFFLGGQGGLILNAVQGQPLLESTHAVSGLAGLSLLTVQALLPVAFDKSLVTRDVHAYLGTATMALLFFHMAQGINLGLSLP